MHNAKFMMVYRLIVEHQKGIGVANIKSRATSYNGITDLVSHPGQGCVLTISFPVTDALLNKS